MVDGIQGFGLFGEWIGLKHVVQLASNPPSSSSASFELELQEGTVTPGQESLFS